MSANPLLRRVQARAIPVSEELHQALLRQEQLFVERFGRLPANYDPLFFDPHATDGAPHPDQQSLEVMARALEHSGVAAHLVYAFRTTNRLVTTLNLTTVPDALVQSWNAAIEQYRARQRQGHR